MKTINESSKLGTKNQDIQPFRSEVQVLAVGSTSKITSPTGLSTGGIKVSEYCLEQYLNACSPTCHG